MRTGDLVAVEMERSPLLIATLLGVWHLNAAFLPLDTRSPPRRNKAIIDHAMPRLVVRATRSHAVPSEDGYFSAALDIEAITDSSDGVVEPDISWPHNLAYVLYTSGSTGRPKGVAIEHSSLANYLQWAARRYVRRRMDSILHTSVSADLTITALWLPLITGNSLHILDDREPLRWHDIAQLDRPLLLKLTPTHMSYITREAKSMISHELSVVVGGEQLTYDRVREWLTWAPGSRIFNEYGPTETTVGSCCYEIAAAASGIGAVPIGTAIDETHLRIVEADLTIDDGGSEIGELWIGGAGVALGYLHSPKLTAARFFTETMAGAEQRWFKTQDLVRRRSDGLLEFLGRMDDQTKIRGFRVEPLEVEAALRTYPGVKQVAVIGLRGERGDTNLHAYLVATDPIDTAELRRHLALNVPDYMIPSKYHFVVDLPMTISGKIDRRNLTER